MLGHPTHILTRRSALAAGLLAIAAIVAFVLLSNGSGATAKASAPPQPSYAAYPTLNSTAPTGLPVATIGTPSATALGAKGPVFPANPSATGPVPTSIRKLPIGLSSVSAWIAKSAEGGICVLASRHQPIKGAYGLGMSCGPGELMESGTFLEMQAEGSIVVTIVGVVPDNVSSVRVTLTNGASETVPASGNAWVLETDAHIENTHDVVGG